MYKAQDIETGKIVAMKKVRFANMDPESVRFMAREIHILRCLDHPNVMKLEGVVTSRISGSLYLVFEYMEHDLAGILARSGNKLSEPQVWWPSSSLLSKFFIAPPEDVLEEIEALFSFISKHLFCTN